ncbi:MAG: hypothetical protein J1F35_00885 [Erysipelotrichales bacterium]|nr:hypothetical protein [Erysipelotrichales bacterium]
MLNKDSVVLGATSALNIWSKNVFPVLFPTFIIADLIISSSFITIFTKYFGSILSKIFKTTKYVAFVLIISLLCGTPTNAKILKNLYENNLIREESITKILTFTYFFNPFFILIFTNVRVLIIFWISNLITGILLRNKYIDDYANTENYNISFNLGESIAKNMNIIINILGTITVFMVISYTIPFINPLFNVIVTSILELTTSLYKIKTYFNINYFYLASLSFGGISILIQIKSIMKDTFIDYKLLIKSRIITLIISLAICWLTQGIAT